MTFDDLVAATVDRMAETPMQITMTPREDDDHRLLFDMTPFAAYVLRCAMEAVEDDGGAA